MEGIQYINGWKIECHIVHWYTPPLDKKGELHQIIHCQIQLTLSKLCQIKVWSSTNSNVFGGIHPPLTCLIQIVTTFCYLLSFISCSLTNYTYNFEDEMCDSSIRYRYTPTNSI